MLTGPELGAAIESARKLKGLTKKALADHFGVKPPSVQDWIKRGTIDKQHLPGLWELFAGTVGPEHWGLGSAQLNTHIQARATLTPNLTTSPAPVPTIEQALPVVLTAITALPAARWASVRAQLDQLAQHPEMRDDVATELLSLLRPAADAGKRSAA